MITVEQIQKRFKDHVAEYSKQGEIEMLHWHKPGTGIESVRYYCHNGSLFITGDLYESVFGFRGSLSGISELDFGYYMSKCKASYHGHKGEIWDSKKAHDWLDDYFKQQVIDEPEKPSIEEIKDKYGDPYNCIDNDFEWNNYLKDNGYEVFGDAFYEFACGIGNIVDPMLYMQFIGLKMAMESLKTKEKEK